MGQPLDFVFLHGAAQGSWVWREALDALERQTQGRFGRALTLDVPGCGTKRGRAEPGFGPDEIAAELLGDIEAAGFRDVVLVGHSLAGTILPRMVERRPELFRRLVFVSAAAPAPGRTFHDYQQTESARTRPAAPPPTPGPVELRAILKPMLCNDMSGAEIETFLAKLGADAWPEQLSGYTAWRYDHLGRVPSSYVACLRDGILSVEGQQRLAERLKVDRLVRIDAGHQVMNTRPHAFAEALLHEAWSS
jgi:pimeloyl-ACP methyl ester carboxylesterase